MGDRILRAVAAALRGCVRDHDIVGRWGGEEFIVVLPSADASAATQIAQRILAATAALTVDLQTQAENKKVRTGLKGIPACTVSIGIATSPDHGLGRQRLVEAADAALYVAKRAGRNRLATAGPDRAYVVLTAEVGQVENRIPA
jgi:diguanylate cyclase (GGDEF)-like protein